MSNPEVKTLTRDDFLPRQPSSGRIFDKNTLFDTNADKENWANFDEEEQFSLESSSIFRNPLSNNYNIDDTPEEDAWMEQLLPHQPSRRGTAPSFRTSHRDRSITTLNYQLHYRVATANHVGNYLSNEEWAAQRRRQEINLRQRQEQQQGQVQAEEPLIWRMHENVLAQRTERGVRSPNRRLFNSTTSEHGEILLQSTSANNPQQEESAWRRECRHRRRHARRVPVTTEARREQLNHWSTLVMLCSWRIVRYPSRLISYATCSRTRPSQPEVNSQPRQSEQVQPSLLARQESAEMIDPLESSSSWEESGAGWMLGQDDHSEGTAYWSTGTALETDSDSGASLIIPTNDGAGEDGALPMENETVWTDFMFDNLEG